MHCSLRASALAFVVATVCHNVLAISKVVRQGKYLFSDGNRFSIMGIAYQLQGAVVMSSDNSFGEPSSFIDPLADPKGCNRDLPYLTKLGVNTLRVYSVDSSLNHDDCMKAFSNAGIYTIIDLSLPLNGSIDRLVPSWSTNILDQYIRTINAFSKYDNVLAYNVGNEVVTNNGTAVAAFVKAAARDIKAYLKSISSFALIGYAAIDGDPGFRDALATYLSCDPSNSNSDATAIDIFGLNNYEGSGNITFETYSAVTTEFNGYNVATYFSETGSIQVQPRTWTEVPVMFSTDMAKVWSGLIAFSYFPATSVQGQFGIVSISSDGKTVTTSDEFTALGNQYSQVTRPNIPTQSNASPSNYPNCPSSRDSLNASITLPATPNEDACNCLKNNLSCRFTPATSNYSAVVGQLTDLACNLVGQQGGSCADIGSDGGSGVYGRLSGCDPTVKLSYIMSQNYQLGKGNAQACSFGGNGTVNSAAPSTASAANAVASSCISNPSATFVPKLPSDAKGGSSSSGGSGGSSGGKKNSANQSLETANVILGLWTACAVSAMSAFWILF